MLTDLTGQRWPVCSQTDPEAFFPESTEPSERNAARAICESCHVRVSCLAECFVTGSEWGIWGGILQRHRQKYHQLFRKTRPDPREFALRVIAEVSEEFGTSTSRRQERDERLSRSEYRRRERARNESRKKRTRLLEEWDKAS